MDRPTRSAADTQTAEGTVADREGSRPRITLQDILRALHEADDQIDDALKTAHFLTSYLLSLLAAREGRYEGAPEYLETPMLRHIITEGERLLVERAWRGYVPQVYDPAAEAAARERVLAPIRARQSAAAGDAACHAAAEDPIHSAPDEPHAPRR